MKRRVISFMLALAMLLSVLPSAAFAAEQGTAVASSSLVDVNVCVLYKDTNDEYADIRIETQLPEDATYQDLYDLAQFPSAEAHTDSLGALTGWKLYYDGESLSDTIVPDSYSGSVYMEIDAVYEYIDFIYTATYLNEQNKIESASAKTLLPVGTTAAEFLTELIPDCDYELLHWHIIGEGDAYIANLGAVACYDGLVPIDLGVYYVDDAGDDGYCSTTIYVEGTPDTLKEADYKEAIFQAVQSMDALCPDGKIISSCTWDYVSLNHTEQEYNPYKGSYNVLFADITLEYKADCSKGHTYVNGVCSACGKTEPALVNAYISLIYHGANNEYGSYIETQVYEDATYQDLYDLLQFPAEDAHSNALGNLTGWELYYDGDSLSDTIVPDPYGEEPTVYMSVQAVYEYDKFIYTAHYADAQGAMISHDEDTLLPVGTTQSQFFSENVVLPDCGYEFSHWHILGEGDVYYNHSDAYACYDGLVPLAIVLNYEGEEGETTDTHYIYVKGTPDTLVEEDVKSAIIQEVQSVDGLCPEGKKISGYVWDYLDFTHSVFQNSHYGESCTGLGAMLTLEYEDIPIVASGTCGENLTWTLGAEGTLTISGEGYMDSWNTYGTPWNSNRNSITSVVIEPGVPNIGSGAFRWCSNLADVTIGSSVTYIGAYAFGNCSSLSEITIPDSVYTIDLYAFNECAGLNKVIIGNRVNSISDWAFLYCESLENIVFTGNAPNIIESAFSGVNATVSYPCSNSSWADYKLRDYGGKLTWEKNHDEIAHEAQSPTCTEIGWDDYVTCSRCDYSTYEEIAAGHSYVSGICSMCGNVEVIASGTCGSNLTWTLDATGLLTISGKGAMAGYNFSDAPWYTYRNNIVTVLIKDGVTSIGASAFKECVVLNGITIPESVTTIGINAFEGCSDLESVVIPDSVTSINGYTFYGCTSLKSITLSNALTELEGGDFADCTSLKEIVIPAGVTTIGDFSFNNCVALESIVIPEGVTTIGNYAFSGCKSLSSIKIPETVFDIGCKAFGGCSNLTSIVLPAGIMAIEEDTFNRCSSLKSITLPATIKSIGKNAFYNCSALESVVIPEGVKSIEPSAFWFCAGLKSITLPATLETVGSDAFYGCNSIDELYIPSVEMWLDLTVADNYANATAYTSKQVSVYVNNELLTELVVPAGYDNIRAYCFKNWGSITDVALPGSITTIDADAFRGCRSLASVVITNGTTAINSYAFQNCEALENITLPGSVTYIGPNAFYMCSSLRSIVIPEGVTSISDYTFYQCSSLTDVIIPDSVTSINKYAFYKCTALDQVTVGRGLETIGYNAFSDCSNYAYVGETNWFNIIFLGAKPSIDSSAFILANASAYYPCNDSTWSDLSGLPKASVTWSVKHSSTIDEAVDATCKAPGLSEGSHCSLCGEVFVAQQIIDALGHDEQAHDGKAATCTESGWKAYVTCSRCDYTTYEEIEALGHDFVDGFCSVCGAEHLIGSGNFGTNITWKLSADGVLTISGEGAMDDFGSATLTPWLGDFSLLTTVVVENGVTSICSNAFVNCNALTNVLIGDSVTSIGNQAFRGCTALTTVAIGESVSSIGSSAFKDCSALTEITIPKSVTTIGNHAFSGCSSLLEYYFEGNRPYIGSDCFAAYGTAYYPCNNTTWSNGNIISGASLTCAPIHGEYLVTETISPTCTDQGYTTYVCELCGDSYQADVVAALGHDEQAHDGKAATCTEIGWNAYVTCSRCDYSTYEEIAAGHTIENGVCTVCGLPEGLEYKASGGEATITEYTGSLTELTIPATIDGNTVTVIGQSAFSGCRSFTSVTIPDSVTTIGGSAFADCINLTSVTIPSSVTKIGDLAFNNCSSLESVTIPSGVTTIGMGIFGYCNSLTEVNLPDTLTTIDTYAFVCCTSLSSITLPESLVEIGSGAFHSCSSLESITIPSGVTNIAGSAFYDCDVLAEIVFTGNAPAFGTDVFTLTTTTAYYPCNNSTWTADKLKDYGGTITWKVQHGEETAISGTAPTCTSTGLTEGVKCSACDAVLVAQETVAALGHDEISHEAKAPTCTEIGWDAYVTCSRCDYSTYKEIAATGHSYEDGICTECGEEENTAVPGDFTGDDLVTNEDVSYLLWHTLFPEDYPLDNNADFTGDGTVTNEDVSYLLWHTLFPADYPL